jgi:hypothetical protein
MVTRFFFGFFGLIEVGADSPGSAACAGPADRASVGAIASHATKQKPHPTTLNFPMH